ncbi:MAG: DUF58 domain-containing protein [Candidatus Brocadia sp.]|jgi:Uncharacterized conserved protein (some members contain a von Willebrand factor type A (vWA) domain)|uniref:DUF58 domain-containing protein n=1 Tax=Candidatus Brocadia fulgida TaxID=380242 RepID=A0A0M2UX00_9BACT|nr:MAG: hypothetical protein BROFUL_00712 [Candidatus Brocadia fulgida]MCC6325361.1 DUF58 domain-containing protein [Candidatus Brocadia sp.]MCE7911164.1 DUF58 domain-containing protein [Candidatus Brocadia sp. AMX3]MBV6518920.1 hypothetical protein [Candidatus Brocadia fulgida]MDG5996577.1 DUF58 domain-containing protein [Candidatus Brocadia sp.]
MAENPFDPVTLSKIANMELRARLIVDGVLSGIHKSPYTGSSIEFLEHKEYSPGNEIKHVDWKVLAKTDKYYVKQFEEETNLRCYLFLDASGSMGYQSKGISKFEYAATLAASLSYLFLKQSDLVGLICFSDRVLHYVPPRSRVTHLHTLLNVLTELKTAGKSNISAVLNPFIEKISHRSLIIVLSDFFDHTEKILHQLQHFRFKRNEVILFHILDPYELTFPFETVTFFESMEDERHILADPKSIKEHYLSGMNYFLGQFKQSCLENQIDYWLIDSSTPLDQALIKFLARRESSLRPARKT